MNNNEVIYISGPMTGLPEYNYPNFFRVEKLLKEKGHEVINPAHIGVQEGWTWQDYMITNLIDLLKKGVTTVLVLEGWENSRGAKLEVHTAKELGMVIITEEDFFKEENQL